MVTLTYEHTLKLHRRLPFRKSARINQYYLGQKPPFLFSHNPSFMEMSAYYPKPPNIIAEALL